MDQNEVIELQKRVVPELSPVFERRYAILRNVHFSQPVGRRTLAARLSEHERTIRRELDILRRAGLVRIGDRGVTNTILGEELLPQIGEYVRMLRALGDLEIAVRAATGLEFVTVVTGDSDQDESVKRQLAAAGALYIRHVLRDGSVLAVTGGTTMVEVGEAMESVRVCRNITVVPARGSLGEDAEKQADTVAVAVARRLKCAYRVLNLPDDLSDQIAARLLEQPRIAEVVNLIRNADVVAFGVGTFDEMAKRRRLGHEEVKRLEAQGAIGEAFGFYFDQEGQTVEGIPSLGIRMQDLVSKKHVIAVGGGKSKAQAILTLALRKVNRALITDEGAAREMLRLRISKAGDLATETRELVERVLSLGEDTGDQVKSSMNL